MKTEHKKHVNIPVFLPESACPQRCVYCNQYLITGRGKIPATAEVTQTIKTYLSTINSEDTHTEVAFFGGNFTGLDTDAQKNLLDTVKPYLKSGQVQGIRLSTRPDFINETVFDFLLQNGVTAIELGIQSLDNNVLKQSGRGYTAKIAIAAAKMIKEAGIELGMQMMTGLPGDTDAGAEATAQGIITCGADTTRIYPLLVIKDTPLEALYRSEKYFPQTLDEAVALASRLYKKFSDAGVKVLKMGLHPAKELTGGAVVAGPFHRSFAELVLSRLWQDIFSYLKPNKHVQITIEVPERSLNHARGYAGANRKWLESRFAKVSFIPVPHLKPFEYNVHYSQL